MPFNKSWSYSEFIPSEPPFTNRRAARNLSISNVFQTAHKRGRSSAIALGEEQASIRTRFERRALGRVRPYGIVACVGIRYVVLSIHCKDADAPSSWRPSASLRRPATSSRAA
ncbi:hypothetical protein B0H12DRAFT_1147136 [Mycena haematopus]|nr:hypothetical protein B0H12DRAFT_1147136 [Mycena haematopus]